MDNKELLLIICNALKTLYLEEKELFERDLCERCLVHRLAIHLCQDFLLNDYFVDCEFNKVFNNNDNTLKQLSSENGNFVDIIIHKRSNIHEDNLICIEVKKHKNRNNNAISKDRKNLIILTGPLYQYKIGLYINLGRKYEETKVEIYQNGDIIKESFIHHLVALV